MRQVFIAALLVVAALAATNCSTVSAPSGSANYYMPPKACVDTDAAIKGCFDAFSRCVTTAGAANATCPFLDLCFAAQMRCLERTTPTSPNCTSWASGLENFGLYLIAGGSYKDSSLEHACEWALCSARRAAFDSGIRTETGNVCEPDLAATCVAPNFEAPTRSPNQAVFSITFGGAEWAELLSNNPKGSPKYREIELAVQRGLAKLLEVLEYLITVLDMRIGSLIVSFIVNDASINVEAIKLKLESLLDNPALVGSLFAELETVSGIKVQVSGVGVEDFSTPAPAAAVSLCAFAAAFVAVLAAMLF